MNGFLNNELNILIQKDTFQQIGEYVIKACEKVRQAHEDNNIPLHNDENMIRSVLVNEFLDLDDIRSEFGMSDFLFEPESSENYNSETCTYVGRTDIKDLLQPDSFNKRAAYFIIECKRIDGGKLLNEKYVNEGIKRFVTKKYSSYYGKNIMLGFVVKDINIKKNSSIIEEYQNRLADSRYHGKLELVYEKDNIVEEYTCKYHMSDEKIELAHIFCNFSNIIK